MGDRGQKKTNQMLEKQTKLQNQFGDVMGQRATEERDYGTGSRGNIDKAYWDLYGGIGSDSGGGGGGGGGGPAYNPLAWANARENEALGGYRNLRDTGGWSDPQIQDFRSRATATMPSFFEGLRNQMSAQNAGLSGNVGYGSQMAKLARDASRGAADTQLGAEVDLQSQIRGAKERGLEGVGRYDTEFMGNQQRVEGLRNQEIANANAAAAAAASAGARNRAASADDAFRQKMGILGELRGLRGEQGTDLAYSDRQLAGYGGASRDVSNRVQEQSLMDKIGQGAGIVGNLAGAAAGAFTGLGGIGGALKPKPSTSGFYS